MLCSPAFLSTLESTARRCAGMINPHASSTNPTMAQTKKVTPRLILRNYTDAKLVQKVSGGGNSKAKEVFGCRNSRLTLHEHWTQRGHALFNHRFSVSTCIFGSLPARACVPFILQSTQPVLMCP